jgi:hypothetical protein
MGERGRRHYVPAAYIGHFSADPNLGNLRRSKIAAHRFDPPADFESAPQNVEFFPGAYRVIPWVVDPGVSIQHGFSSLAAHALRPVDRLRGSSSNDLPADEWAKVAAFVASLFVPYPVLDAALNKRPRDMRVPRDLADVGYSRNTQRIVSAVLRARWECLRTPKDLILNDRAVSAVQFRDWGRSGYFIPLRKDFGVRITRGPYPKQITWNGSDWRIAIPVATLSEEQTDNLNRWTWFLAVDEVYGSSLRLLAEIEERATAAIGAPVDFHDIMVAGILGASDQERLEDQVLLFRLLGEIDPPENPADATTIVV